MGRTGSFFPLPGVKFHPQRKVLLTSASGSKCLVRLACSRPVRRGKHSEGHLTARACGPGKSSSSQRTAGTCAQGGTHRKDGGVGLKDEGPFHCLRELDRLTG